LPINPCAGAIGNPAHDGVILVEPIRSFILIAEVKQDC
jgi:hypothetical protein